MTFDQYIDEQFAQAGMPEVSEDELEPDMLTNTKIDKHFLGEPLLLKEILAATLGMEPKLRRKALTAFAKDRTVVLTV